MLKIDTSACTGCGACIASCSFGAIAMKEDLPVVGDNCVFCGNCARECPVSAIALPQTKKRADSLDEYRDVWAVLELEPGRNRLRKVSLELLSEARRLADILGHKAGGALLCSEVPDGLADAVSEVGCDYLHVVKHKDLAHYHTERFCDIVVKLAQTNKPSGILFPATENGRDLAPRVSCAMQVGLTADCTDLGIDDDKNIMQIRPTYGGNIMATIISPNHRPQLASVRPNVLSVVKKAKPARTEIRYAELTPDPGCSSARLVGVMEKDTVFRDVAEADIVIVVGYGVGSKENFHKLEKLAVKMNAAIGATRKVVDEGWAPFEVQVGQTGKTVAPSLYIACGVSGALQHTIGMKNAKYKIAVNTDPAAPIFSVCDVAILGDCVKVATELCEKIVTREAVGFAAGV